MRKYSESYERDFIFYLNNLDSFDFCGTLTPKHQAISDPNGKSAKEVFFLIDSTGKNVPCKEPELLNKLLLCKASVNFHIKQWAEGRAEGTLPFCEFAGDSQTLEWNIEVRRHRFFWWLPKFVKRFFGFEDKRVPISTSVRSIAKQYSFPDWVISAVERQKEKILKQKGIQYQF